MSPIERLLAPIPSTTFAQCGTSASQRWTADYNVACWVRGRASAPIKLSLVIRYRDGGGEHQLTVDGAECRQTEAMLLAGRLTVPATGPVTDMSVWLLSNPAGPAGEVLVDELYVQRVGAAVGAKPVLAMR